MRQKLRVLEFLTFAIMTLTAVAAQPAPAAASGLLTAEVYPATVTGTQLNIQRSEFTSWGSPTQCEVSKFSGELTSPGSSTLTVHPTYENCIGFGFGIAITIDTEGCNYVIHIGETVTPGGNYTGSTDVECSAGKVIKLTAGFIGNKCEVQIGTQTGLNTIELVNKVGSPKDVEIKTNIAGITYKVTKDEGACPLSNVGETRYDLDYMGNNVTFASSSGLSVTD